MTIGLQEQLQDVLGDAYHIERELGGAGMSRVFVALERSLGRRVVVKLLPREMLSGVSEQRFLREINLTANLPHPHILPVLTAGGQDDLLYYITPFLEGESLRERMDRGPVPLEEGLPVLCEVADAIAFAHTRGIIHRDIKPGNILLQDGHAVLADFGIARAIERAMDPEADYTASGIIIGTPLYMSPECFYGRGESSPARDVFAFAVVAYEMLTGLQPFPIPAVSSFSPGRRRARDIAEIVPAIPRDAAQWIMRALDSDPQNRPDAPTFKATVRSAPTVVSRGRKRAIAVGVAGAMIVLAAGLIWRDYHSRQRLDGSSSEALERELELRRIVGGMDRHRMVVLRLRPSIVSAAELASFLGDDLFHRLAMSRRLKLIPLDTAYRIPAVSAFDSLARALQVGSLIVGDVRQNGASVTASVRLVDGATGIPLDSAIVTSKVDDVLTLTQGLKDAVVGLVRQHIDSGIHIAPEPTRPNGVEVWSIVRRADQLSRTGSISDTAIRRSLAVADSLLARAQWMDPAWGEPAIRRSQVLYRLGRFAESPKERLAWFNASIAQADRAIQLAPASPGLSEAYLVRGSARFTMVFESLIPGRADAVGARTAAKADLIQATQLNPGNAWAWMPLSTLYANEGDLPGAHRAAASAYRANPFVLGAQVLDRLYRTAYVTEQLDEALTYCAEGQLRFPTDPRFVQCQLWLFSHDKPRTTETLWRLVGSYVELSTATRREWARHEGRIAAAIALGKRGQADSARRVLDRIQGRTTQDPDDDLLYMRAYAYLTLGEKKRALSILRDYLALHPEHAAGWGKNASWWWRDLGKDPEFQQMVSAAQGKPR